MERPVIEPITAATLPEFGAFLSRHLDASRSAAEWTAALSVGWMANPPNHGFLLREAGAVVGGIGALYAERLIDGRPERFCNITSWCVLDSHRRQSMRLAMAVVGQPGFHFTDLSPTQVVSGTLQFLKFKPLDERQVVALNLPWPTFDGLRTVTDPAEIARCLAGAALQAFEDHRHCAWLHHVLIGKPGGWCHVVYKRGRFKGLPAALLLHAGPPAALLPCWRRLSRHLLAQGLVSAHVEYRLLGVQPWPSAIRSGFHPKLFRSETLAPQQIDYLYSEQSVLDL